MRLFGLSGEPGQYIVLPPGGAKRRIAPLFRPWPGIALIKEE